VNLELPRTAVLTVAAFLAASVGLLLLMLAQLGVLPVPGASSRTTRVIFADAEGLPVQADVLVHGVKVGTVGSITVRAQGSTLVTLDLDSSTPALHPDASAEVGSKTPLGEPFVDLNPGHAPGRLTGMLHARASVEIDDALKFLNAGGRANLHGALLSLGEGAASPNTSSEVSGTVAQLQPLTEALGRLMGELGAQRHAISSIVSNGRVALDTLSTRSRELRSLDADAGTMLSAVAGQRQELTATLNELPGLLQQATSTLTDAKPLIKRAGPLAADVGRAAPPLASALRQVPATASALDSLLSEAPALRRYVPPALSLVRSLAGPGSTAMSLIGFALADIVPVAQYLGPRGRTIAAWFSNTAALGDHGDAKGDWARFFVLFDRSTLTGNPSGGPPGNAYTKPGDAAHNQAYRPGGYPRLEPYWPALAPRR
jgi:phospholipid/cholesterol/gamma-HCH transport system substrate-binding protein